MKYIEPKIEIVKFSAEDVITDSAALVKTVFSAAGHSDVDITEKIDVSVFAN